MGTLSCDRVAQSQGTAEAYVYLVYTLLVATVLYRLIIQYLTPDDTEPYTRIKTELRFVRS